jgi:hypothetical protein
MIKKQEKEKIQKRSNTNPHPTPWKNKISLLTHFLTKTKVKKWKIIK